MKPNVVKGTRIILGISQDDMAKELGIGSNNYAIKDRGEREFSSPAMAAIAKKFGWGFDKVNEYFFDSIFPMM